MELPGSQKVCRVKELELPGCQGKQGIKIWKYQGIKGKQGKQKLKTNRVPHVSRVSYQKVIKIIPMRCENYRTLGGFIILLEVLFSSTIQLRDHMSHPCVQKGNVGSVCHNHSNQHQPEGGTNKSAASVSVIWHKAGRRSVLPAPGDDSCSYSQE